MILNTILKFQSKNKLKKLKKDPQLSNITLIINEIIRVKGTKRPYKAQIASTHTHTHTHTHTQTNVEHFNYSLEKL